MTLAVIRMSDLDLVDRRVLIREDLNVPIDNGKVANDNRIQAALPTIKLALADAKQVILMSHLGRPEEGVPIAGQAQFSLQPVAEHLGRLLECEVPVVTDYLGKPEALAGTGASLVLLENVRVNSGEKSNDEALSRQYASLADIFVMDAFGTAHRAQASTHGVARFAATACAGPLLAGELEALARSLEDPARPMLAIVGGAKVSSKLQVLEALAEKVDQLIVGGGIANTFLLANGTNIGKSLCEPDMVATARKLMQSASIPLPSDVVVAKEFSADAEAKIKNVAEIDDDDMILDIGPETAEQLATIVAGMQTILWNGPLGVFEFPQFAGGTRRIAEAIADNSGYSLAGGGETVSAIDQFGISKRVSYISTGGGAFLEYVEGKILPAVQILNDRGAG